MTIKALRDIARGIGDVVRTRDWPVAGAVALRDIARGLWAVSRKGPVLEETQRFLLLAIVIGIFSGLVVVCFHISIEFLNWNTVHSLDRSTDLWMLLWPALGGGAAYLLVYFVFPTARGTGVNYTKAGVYASDGYVPFSSVIGKFLSSTLSIGSGNPMGPEDPALQMGAGIASLLGRLFHLTRDHMRLIAPVGAAAGIGAAFNTPITAVLFVMEEVMSAWSAGAMGSIVLSAVSAVVVSRWFLGDDPLYSVPEFELTNYSELLVYAVIGVAGGWLSALYTRHAAALRDKILQQRQRVRLWLPVAAGLFVGLIGIQAPGVLGAGYESIDSALHDRFTWKFLLLLGGLKMVLSAVCLSAGTPGGMFAPTLFIGAMIGGGLGGLADIYWPLPTSSTGAYVLVGMGAFFAGLFRAPMTSVFMVFEVSANYVIILPVMIANTISYRISRRMQPDSLFHILGHQDGLDLPSVEEKREAPVLHVEDAMRKDGKRVAPAASATVDDALAGLDEDGASAILIDSGYGRWTWVSRRDLERVWREGWGAALIKDALPLRSVIRTYPDLPLDQALRKLGVYPVLPVASRVNPNYMVGTLTLADVHRTYGIPKEEVE